jgi:hypothetical protein
MSSRLQSARLIAGRLLLIGLALGACGGGNKNDQSVSTTSTTSTTASSGTGTSTVRRVKIEYPSGGPDGPIVPPQTKAYAMLAAGECRPLLDEITGTWGQPMGPNQTSEGVDLAEYFLYRTAAELCLQRWDAATADFSRLQDVPPAFTSSDCPETNDEQCDRCLQVVYAWVNDLIQRRKADPSFTPEFVAGNPGRVCPTTTTNSSSSSSSSSTFSSSTSGSSTTTSSTTPTTR